MLSPQIHGNQNNKAQSFFHKLYKVVLCQLSKTFVSAAPKWSKKNKTENAGLITNITNVP